jgi:hypothetical protein
MGGWVLVFDIETVPDLGRFALANGFEGKSDEEVREAMGDANCLLKCNSNPKAFQIAAMLSRSFAFGRKVRRRSQ